MYFIFGYLIIGLVFLTILGITGLFSKTIHDVYVGFFEKKTNIFNLPLHIISALIVSFNVICLWALFILGSFVAASEKET